MIKRIVGYLVLLLFVSQILKAQECIQLGHEAHSEWHVLSNTKISNDGDFIVYERNPYRGDGELIISKLKDLTVADTILRAKNARVSPGNLAVAFEVYPAYDSLKKLKLEGIKKDKLPKDSLGVFVVKERKLIKFPKVRSYEFPKENRDLLVWLHEPGFEPEHDNTIDSLKPKKKSPKKDDPVWMGVWDLKKDKKHYLEKVKQFDLAENGAALFYVQKPNDTIDSLTVNRFDMDKWTNKYLYSFKGEIKQFKSDNMGDQLALVSSSDTTKRKLYNLVYWDIKSREIKKIDSLFPAMPDGFHVSEFGNLRFSDDQQALFFGIAPKPLPETKDTLIDDEKVSVDIWNWKDQQLQTQQIKQLEREKKKNYLAVYYPAQQRFVQLGSEKIPNVQLDTKLNPKFMLGSVNDHYQYLNSWEQTRYVDYYRINRLNGDTLKLLEKANSMASLSPQGDYLVYFNRHDSAWYSLEIETMHQNMLGGKQQDVFYNQENDIPNEAGPLGFVGWTEDGKALVYSWFGIWQFDPSENSASKRLIGNVQNKYLRYRYQRTDPEETYLPEEMMFSVFDRQSKQSGFAVFNRKQEKLKLLRMEDARLSGLIKAKNAKKYLFRQETFSNFPDYYLTNKDWKSTKRITEANPQQSDYCWGSVELVSWISYAGDSLEGLMYLPAAYKESGSYPVLVYYYERYSDNLYRHSAPKPSRSVINFSDYTSRGYGVFVPDIVYRTGEPGQSAYDAVMSGIDHILVNYPGLDSTRMGLQGQSWGGYQTAWLITRTDRFKAAMAGAPVSNMTSAYGGIRWGSGLVRAFQYEDGQSRIGKDLWSDLDAYIENSPLFFADKVNTPLLMMHNDNDGAVPWYQGIEYFTALRRLQKPVWMLVYNGAPHNLSRFADMQDLTLRLEQFFDHYLLGAPEPVWMKEGVKAIDKGRSFGFEY